MIGPRDLGMPETMSWDRFHAWLEAHRRQRLLDEFQERMDRAIERARAAPRGDWVACETCWVVGAFITAWPCPFSTTHHRHVALPPMAGRRL